MVQITLFEIHLDDATMTANAPFSSDSGDEPSTADGGNTGDDEQGGAPIAPLVGLVVVVVLALAAKKLLGGSDVEAIDIETE